MKHIIAPIIAVLWLAGMAYACSEPKPENVIKSRFVFTEFKTNARCSVWTLKDIKTSSCWVYTCEGLAPAREDVCR